MLNAFRHTLAVLTLAALPMVSLAEDVKQEFDRLFGAEVKRVTASPDPADDIELAQQLLNAAKGSTDKPAMRDHLCEYAFALGSRDVSGYPVAVEAMQFIAENAPADSGGAAKRAECDQKIAALYQRGYERATGEKKTAAGQQYIDFLIGQADAKIVAKEYAEALNLLRKARPVAVTIKSNDKDAIQTKIDTYTQLAAVSTKIETAEKKLKANPWDKPTHAQLLELYLTDMDDSAKASKYLEVGGDETQKKMVPLAAKPVLDITEPQALSLAEFYESLSKKGLSLTRIAMLTRSKGYYEHYLTLHTAEDVQKAAASVNMKRISDALAKLEAEVGAATKKTEAADGKTLDLLDYVDPSRDAQRGRWSRVGESIKSERGGFTEVPLLRPPVRVDGGSYNLKVKFVRDTGAGGGNLPNVPGFGAAGEGSVAFIFPVGAAQVAYTLNAIPSGASGLADIAGQGPDRNATRKDVTVNSGKVHFVDINVKLDAPPAEGESATASIAISFDGKQVVDWKGKESDLSLNDLLKPGDAKAFAFLTFNAGVTIGSAKLKMTSGKAEPTEKPVDKSVKAETAKNDKAAPAKRDDERREREKMIEDFFKGRSK